MTEKKAAFGNNFTPEQRAAALKRAAEMRAARAEYLDRVKSGEVAIATALADGKEKPVIGRIKAKRLLMALPGVGAAKAQSAMTAIGIAESRRASGSDRPKNSLNFSGRCARCVAPRGNEEPYARPWSRRPSGGGSFLSRSRVSGVRMSASRSGNMNGRGGGRGRARIASRANIPAAPEGAR